jgi:hypothetical protein
MGLVAPYLPRSPFTTRLGRSLLAGWQPSGTTEPLRIDLVTRFQEALG